jgi:hypothetical protein
MKGEQNCSYFVMIETSCSSPKFTTDEISIAFGDANGNQVFPLPFLLFIYFFFILHILIIIS